MKKLSLILLTSSLAFAGFFGGGGSSSSDDTTYESNSTDNFAVRPKEFNVSKYPKVVKAGSEFNLTVDALDANGSQSKDYNETLSLSTPSPIVEYNDTKAGCFTGSLTGNDKNFSNGEANISLRYSEVGELNLTIAEQNGSEFAKVDEDDTNSTQRFIKEKSITITFIPHHFEKNASLSNGDSGFTYYDYDVNRSALIDVNITAKNEQNETTKNYNNQCYAKDIEVNLSLNRLNNGKINLSKVRYYFEDRTGDKSSLKEVLLNSPMVIDYNETNFSTDRNGSAEVKVYFNFDRDFSAPSSPMEVNISEIDVSDKNISDTNQIYSNFDGNALFYYGNVLTKDIISYENENNETLKMVVFDDNLSDTLKPAGKMEYYEWFFNNLHQNRDGNLSNDEIVVSSDYNASNKITGIDVNVTSVSNGKIAVDLKRNDSSISFAVIHLLSPSLKWLWYSEYKNPYDITKNSTCLNHFCWTVTYKIFDNGDVGGGIFKGTESNVTETNITKEKIYR